VGELLIGLGEKVRAAGPEAVRILTEEELQRQQLNWFRAGWEEHARATDPDHPTAPSPHPGHDSGRHPDSEDFPAQAPAQAQAQAPIKAHAQAHARLLRFPERPPDAQD
jgi:hypothetical protein